MQNSTIVKPGGAVPDEFEKCIAQALEELKANSELQPHLRDLYITRAREIKSGINRAIIIYVPISQLKALQTIQISLIRELEVTFFGRHVLFIAQRNSLPKPTCKAITCLKRKHPLSSTLTTLFDAILEDIVFPAKIVGKCLHVKPNGSRLLDVHLDKNHQTTIEHKMDTITAIYKKLTDRVVSFDFVDN